MIRREAKDFITVHVTAPYGSENGRLDKLLDFRACNFVAIFAFTRPSSEICFNVYILKTKDKRNIASLCLALNRCLNQFLLASMCVMGE